jgi:hypothetical protein
MTVQTFDHRHPIIIKPSEIRAGDWMRDLGTLRQVESVASAEGPCADGVSVRFVDGVDGAYATLSVREHVPVTVWRAMRQQASEASGRVAA